MRYDPFGPNPESQKSVATAMFLCVDVDVSR